MEFPDARLLIFAKAPIPGRVKTRLLPTLGSYRAAALQRQLSEHTLAMATGAKLCPIDLWCEPNTRHPFFVHCRRKFGVSLQAQQGVDLGRRMSGALMIALRQAKSAVIIGTDCPGLTAEDLQETFVALSVSADVVLGPAEDGGYVLIGVRRYSRRLFSGISWGSNQVLQQTRARLRMLNWRGGELVPRWDVDRPYDLKRMEQEYPTILARLL
jgi:rSAM/selenodomain-associated transferase 1